MKSTLSKEEKARISKIFYDKHIDDFNLMFPYHKGEVKNSELHAFVRSLEKNEKMREHLELIKDVRSAYLELYPDFQI